MKKHIAIGMIQSIALLTSLRLFHGKDPAFAEGINFMSNALAKQFPVHKGWFIPDTDGNNHLENLMHQENYIVEAEETSNELKVKMRGGSGQIIFFTFKRLQDDEYDLLSVGTNK